MILPALTRPASEKKSSNSREVSRAANCVTKMVRLSLSSSGTGGEGDRPPRRLLGALTSYSVSFLSFSTKSF
ncbi:hypothetical protein BCR43DRAFT_492376 [Syncephalastrum racemosum]|uniref:Uncharacterized protein n=1 Tax=Syncephalastrum racemosum TaxID=13706 RepID=A0A1X2HDN2_SYNRA|nr:hypothetical protein BCR43DRAFT_492376 [Syncephalastrum racemosum]